MEQFFAKADAGAPFQLFGPAHLIALAVILLLNLSIISLRRNPSQRLRKTIRYSLAAILISNEVAWHLWNAATGQWTIQTMLPLHLCSILVWTGVVMLVSRNYAIYEFAYFLGIAGAIQALLTPDLGFYSFPHFRFFQTFISHGLIVTSAIYMTLMEGFRPTWKSLRRVGIGINIYMIAVFILNQLIKSNYMFVAHKPETPSLIDVLGPWPVYILALEGIGLVMLLLLYLPFALRDRKSRSTTPNPAAG
jgi:hypothetical integral membrane protein (TIGR02206 family)